MFWIIRRQGAVVHQDHGREQHVVGDESSADEESNRTDHDGVFDHQSVFERLNYVMSVRFLGHCLKRY
jgi:hypothetical protein